MKSINKGNIPDKLYDSDVVLYGAGITGRRILKLLQPYQVHIKYVIDDDMNKWGSRLEDAEIISYREFAEYCTQTHNIAVILTTIYGKTVLKKIRTIDSLSEIEVYEMYAWLDEAYGLNCLIGGLDNPEEIEEFHERSGLLKTKLSDEESKRVLDGIYAYMCTRDFNAISDICTEEEQYFIPEILEAIHGPLNLVDGGAYVGELYQTMRDHNIELGHWYCFEADEDNYQRLLCQSEKTGLDGIQVCIKKGLWDREGKLYFDSEQGTASRIVDYETNNQIETVSLDSYFRNRNCNFIKMDIEGAEYEALRGGMETIKRDRPILTISIYHSVEDFYRIPEYLMKELTGYKYYIRHHALILCETVLYAIPDELL